jgi:23S rRNA (cytosine1962-C5)-methyltransferase
MDSAPSSTSSSSTKPPPRLRLRVGSTAESIIRGGHPWVYSDSIREQNREGTAGELAVVYDRNDRFLAVGLYDPESPIRIRVLHAGKPVTLDEAWWLQRLRSALGLRTSELLGPHTTGFRCLNGEGDGWPGLVLDRYADHLVLKVYSAAWLPWLPLLARLIHAELTPSRLVFRVSRNIESESASRGYPNASLLSPSGEAIAHPDAAEGDRVVFEETRIRFEVDVFRGQKTGFFLDQRENRRRVGQLSAGREVLNAFSCPGGFSLYAARAGARSVLVLDLSAHALESGRRNWELNRAIPEVAACHYEQAQGDAFGWLAESPPRVFDVVVVDPPSLAKREVERSRAIEAYGRLAASAIRRVRPGGFLVSASCSAHVSEAEFFAVVREAARSSRRPFSELETTGPAGDHPTRIPELRYLKAIYLSLS